MSEHRIAIIDDDPFVIAHLRQALERRFPGVEVLGVADPVAPAGFDAYIVDREFDGDTRGREVVRRIRLVEPRAVVLAYSAYLDREYLRALLGEGCEGAFDKGSLAELDAMLDVLAERLEQRARPAAGFGATVRAIGGLVREWNTRLEASGRAEARVYGDV